MAADKMHSSTAQQAAVANHPAIKTPAPATDQRRQANKHAAASNPRKNLDEEAAWCPRRHSIWLPPWKHHRRKKNHHAEPDLVQKIWLKSFGVGLIRRDARFPQSHMRRCLPPAEHSSREEHQDAMEPAAEHHGPTLVRHGATQSHTANKAKAEPKQLLCTARAAHPCPRRPAVPPERKG